jgi:hypothetical protein
MIELIIQAWSVLMIVSSILVLCSSDNTLLKQSNPRIKRILAVTVLGFYCLLIAYISGVRF